MHNFFCGLANLLQVHLGDTPHNLTESDFESLARKTEGFSGSDISVCVSASAISDAQINSPLSFFLIWMAYGGVG